GAARNAHVDPILQGPSRIASAHPTTGEFRHVVSDQPETRSGAAGCQVRGAIPATVGDAFKTSLEVDQEIGGLLQPSAIELQSRMHVEAQSRLRAAQSHG